MNKRNHHKKLSEVLESFIVQKPLQNGYNEISIQKFWKEKMGTLINNYTTKITLKNKILRVYISSSALKQELTYNTPKIVNLIEKEFGSEYINEIQIR